MELERFWGIVEDSRSGWDPNRADGNFDRQCKRLGESLSELTVDEVVAFDHCYTKLWFDAYRWDLWAAAFIIEGGCSEDGFMDFRGWLISMAYEAAINNPEALVDIADAPGVECTQVEGFSYVATEVFENKTGGQEMPESNLKHPTEPDGQRWTENESDLERNLPRLFAKYWGRW